ncbi:MAG: hypothetical protein EXX96DRAFT_471747 [Benjaminiella poitrasii]|nr:MAG: hypothetical protein EXX96DRAFT_471747 [Benjaminiella poitrasii]
MIGPTIPENLSQKKQQNEDEIPISFSDDEQEDLDQAIGPQMPTDLLKKRKQTETVNNGDEIYISDEEDDKSTHIGPQMPKQFSSSASQRTIEEREDHVDIGPQIPQPIIKQKESSSNDDNNESAAISQNVLNECNVEEDSNDYTPALPPDLIEERRNKQVQQPKGRRRRPVGPSLPTDGPRSQEIEDNFVIGPTLPKDYNPEEESKYSAIADIEERARQIDYLKKANSSKSRQFSNSTMSQKELDNSGWTETPSDKQQRLNEQALGKRKAKETGNHGYINRQSELEMRRNVEEYNKQSRPMSLLEMHQLKKKKSAPTSADDVTKRPFDREKDLLGSKKLDRRQKKELFKQSSQLTQNFGYGSTSFL